MRVSSILFVCLGNICRSPLAEGIARDIAAKGNLDIKIDSCGTSGFHEGNLPDERSIKVAKKYSIDITNQRSRPISENDKGFDLIIAMDESNKRDILKMGFLESKVFKLGEFGSKNEDIPDPYYYRDDGGFEIVFNMIYELMIELFKKNRLIK